jgi:serine/threonine-protein kinase
VAVCNTVAYAHSRGVLHRDLKPGNIMLGKFGETLVVDWGLAKAVGSGQGSVGSEEEKGPPSLARRASEGSAETQAGRALGTPAYMSPEQAAGRLDEVGPASDVYSLGATLYTILTGRPPVEGRDLSEILKKVEHGEVTPPRQVAPEVPRALEAICRRAMALRPEDRYASPLDLAADLEHWLADEPVAAWREPAQARLGRWARRHRTLVAVAVALLATAVLALGLSTVLVSLERDAKEEARRNAVQNLLAAKAQEKLTDEQRQLAGRRQAEAEENFQKARQAVDELLGEVGQRWLADVPLMQPVRRRLLERAVVFYQGFLKQKSKDPDVRRGAGQAYRKLAEVYVLLGQEDKALQACRDGLALFAGLAKDFPGRPEFRRDQAGFHRQLSSLYQQAGKLPDAHAELRRALALDQELARAHPDRPEFQADLAFSHDGLSRLLRQMHRPAKVEDHCLKALAIRRKLAERQPARPENQDDLASSYESLGSLRRDQGRAGEARDSFRKALELRKKLARQVPTSADYRNREAAAYDRLGLVLTEADRPKEAREAFDKALEIGKMLSDDFPTTPDYRWHRAGCENNLANLLDRVGDQQGALAAHRRALALVRKLAEDFPGRPDYRKYLSISYSSVGGLLERTGHPKEAADLFRQAIAVREKLAKDFPDQPDYRSLLADGLANLATAYYHLKRPAEGVPLYDRIIALRRQLVQEQPGRPNHRQDLADDYTSRAALRLAQGQTARAREDYQRARDLWRELLKADPKRAGSHSRLARVQHALASILLTEHKPAEARSLLEEAVAEQWTAFTLQPTEPNFPVLYRLHCDGLADALLALRAHEGLAKLARDFAGGWQGSFRAAELTARCVTFAGADDKLPAARRKELAEQYAGQAMGLLARAVRQGLNKARPLADSPHLEPLRARPDFRRLVERLDKEKKGG